jgi:hypothetical protein
MQICWKMTPGIFDFWSQFATQKKHPMFKNEPRVGFQPGSEYIITPAASNPKRSFLIRRDDNQGSFGYDLKKRGLVSQLKNCSCGYEQSNVLGTEKVHVWRKPYIISLCVFLSISNNLLTLLVSPFICWHISSTEYFNISHYPIWKGEGCCRLEGWLK